MTSEELLVKITPTSQKLFTCQQTETGLNVNLSDVFTPFIRDAARCNSYCSDIYYDMKSIDAAFRRFNPEEGFTPIWIGFRKSGVDSTSYILSRVEEEHFYGSLSHNYFALYSLRVKPHGKRRLIDRNDMYDVVLSEYAV